MQLVISLKPCLSWQHWKKGSPFWSCTYKLLKFRNVRCHFSVLSNRMVYSSIHNFLKPFYYYRCFFLTKSGYLPRFWEGSFSSINLESSKYREKSWFSTVWMDISWKQIELSTIFHESWVTRWFVKWLYLWKTQVEVWEDLKKEGRLRWWRVKFMNFQNVNSILLYSHAWLKPPPATDVSIPEALLRLRSRASYR